MQIRQLHNLEPPILPDARHGLQRLLLSSPVDGEVGGGNLGGRIQQQGGARDGPPGAGLDGVVAKQHVDGCDGAVRVAHAAAVAALDPEAAGARLPALDALIILAGIAAGALAAAGPGGALGGGDVRVEAAHADVDDDAVVRGQLLLALALDV